MAATRTEQRHRHAEGLDMQPPLRVLEILAEAQVEAAQAVHGALAAISTAAELGANAIAGGGRLAYAAAGSSGLMALADALELPGTYGIPRHRIAILFAGGAAALQDLTGGAEDEEAQGASDVAAAGLGRGDCAIGVSASGSTPYTIGALREARNRGASTVAIANNDGAPLFALADAAVLLATPPEVIAGSTRMGAGTAQKIALNLFSTLMAVRLGHVHDGYMVNLVADNAKLVGRAARIVAAVAGVPLAQAEKSLENGGGSVKTAVLIAAGVPDRAGAERILEGAGYNLRQALSAMQEASAPATSPPQGENRE